VIHSGLGTPVRQFYGWRVIGVLRFIGILNAAVWLGGAVFFTLGVGRVPFSTAMRELLTEANYPYFSGAIAQLLIVKYFALHIICGAISLAHLGAEWLYQGRPARRSTLILLLCLFGFGLLGSTWLQPKMERLHRQKYAPNLSQTVRDRAAKSFRIWHATTQGLNLVVLGSLCVYVWRANHPPDPTRFVTAMQFRG
jgi:hypothetical protein